VREIKVCTEHLLVRLKQHAAVEFMTAKGVSLIEIHWQIKVVCGHGCVEVSAVHHWTKKCKGDELVRADLCD
jgi:hypothetical protein